MSTESGKYWEQIQAIRKQIEEEARAALGEAELVLQEGNQEAVKRQRAATLQLKEIFEDIKANAPEIRNAPRSEILEENEESNIEVYLRWGNRLDTAFDDLSFVVQHNLATPAISPENVPDKVVSIDYYYLHAEVSPQTVALTYRPIRARRSYESTDPVPLEDFLNDPSHIFPSIALALRNPLHQYKEYRRGIDYWLPHQK